MEIKYIQPLLVKKPWQRLVNQDMQTQAIADSSHYDLPQLQPNGLFYQFLGNAELLNESTEGAHEINSNIFSTRPIFELVEKEIELKDNAGQPYKKKIKEEVIVGYDKVETVRSGLAEMIISQHASHLGKNGIETADEYGKDPEAYDIFRAYKDETGLDAVWTELLYHAGKCGDVAIVQQVIGKKIEYTIFSYLLGDMLFVHKDETGRPMFVRKYMLNGKTAVDIFAAKSISTWIQGDIDKEKDSEWFAGWFNKVKGWFKNINIKRSLDGWTRISEVESQLDENTPMWAYLRLQDSFIGHSMQNLNAYDRALSYTSDKMRSTAFSKLLVKAPKLKNLPPTSSGEEVIGIEGDIESLKASDVKHIVPPDISNIAPINLKNIKEAIMESSMSIDLQPEILKSGADSSQTLKLLLRRELQWCHIMWPKVRPFAKQIVDTHLALVGKIEGEGERYSKLRISVWNTPWLPQDEDALADRATKLLYASVLSAKGAREELNLQYVDDENQIRKEQEEKIYRETYIKFKAEAQARKDFGIEETANDIVVDKVPDNADDNPFKPGIDNKAPNK